MKTANYTLENANEFIRQKEEDVITTYSPSYHLTAPVGWINDPNGFVYYEGEYHLFYQYYPYKTVWGPMHWGHAKSKDLVTWENLPVALSPDQYYDEGGCFSGSAIEKDGKLYLMYTGHLPQSDEEQSRQIQCMAVSEDGIHFEKISQNPVLDEKDLPDNARVQDFRDPKVFERNGVYYSIIASQTKELTGQILLYQSTDLIEWEFKSILLEGTKEQGIMWECPDLFELDGKDVLITSPIQIPKSGNEFHNVSSCVAFIGKVDWEKGTYEVESMEEIDYGLDFYAPQTTIDEQGRRVMVAWMQMWGRNMPTHTENHGWVGAMTLPRELRIKDGKLIQLPISEISNYYQKSAEIKEVVLVDETKEFEGVAGKVGVLELVVDLKEATRFRIELRASATERTLLTYHTETNELEFDRFQSGIPISGEEAEPLNKRKVLCSLDEAKLKLKIFLDNSSIETFVNDGKETITSTIYPLSDESEKIYLEAIGKVRIDSLDMFEIDMV